jgi:hypothetical protein
MLTSVTSFEGATFDDTELGVVTVIASAGLNLVVRIKNDNNRNATSHIAVISTAVLFRAILGLPMV